MAESIDWIPNEEKIIWKGNPRIQKLFSLEYTDYILTDRAVYRKTGIFSKNVKKIGLDKIQDISFNQGIMGNLFGYGNVNISTAGGSGVEMCFRSVDRPQYVQGLINEHSKDFEEEEEEGEIVNELRQIREVLERIEDEI